MVINVEQKDFIFIMGVLTMNWGKIDFKKERILSEVVIFPPDQGLFPSGDVLFPSEQAIFPSRCIKIPHWVSVQKAQTAFRVPPYFLCELNGDFRFSCLIYQKTIQV